MYLAYILEIQGRMMSLRVWELVREIFLRNKTSGWTLKNKCEFSFGPMVKYKIVLQAENTECSRTEA